MRLSSDLGRSTPRSIARGERCAVCGLAGYLGDPAPEGAERALLERMIHTLAHRGPDGYGFHAEPGVGLAHARLSIIDLATGDQPRSEEHTSELQSLMRISYAVFCLKKKKNTQKQHYKRTQQLTQ